MSFSLSCHWKPKLIEIAWQVVHPFYVFQIASIILWSLDDYYYYAFCIALISFASIASTLIDTKRVWSLTQPQNYLSSHFFRQSHG